VTPGPVREGLSPRTGPGLSLVPRGGAVQWAVDQQPCLQGHEAVDSLRYLFGHGSKPEFVTRFRWEPGSIAFWDNRQVWHLAVNDYHGMLRVMNRILLTGAKPVPAA